MRKLNMTEAKKLLVAIPDWIINGNQCAAIAVTITRN